MKRTVSMLLAFCIAAGVCVLCRAEKASQTAQRAQTTAAETTETAAEPETTAVTTEPETAGETTAAKPETTAETTEPETAAETTAAEPKTTAAPLVMTPAEPFDPAKRLEPTKSDYERLERLLDWSSFFWMDYDSETDRVLDLVTRDGAPIFAMRVYDLLREGENFAYNDAMDEDVMHIGNDPRGYSPYGGYQMIRADVMEYYLENVFHNFNYPDAREKHETYTDDSGVDHTAWDYYYEDGWYYFRWSGRCNESGPLVRDCETMRNGHYLLTVDLISCVDQCFVEGTIEVDATLTEKDGRRLWTIYSSKVTYNRYAPTSDQNAG
ncbi:MAG: hypothetical protein IKW76_00945 [Clostridia bacterium]|nr:hypothetical protein [Clostridia bacterium]